MQHWPTNIATWNSYIHAQATNDNLCCCNLMSAQTQRQAEVGVWTHKVTQESRTTEPGHKMKIKKVFSLCDYGESNHCEALRKKELSTDSITGAQHAERHCRERVWLPSWHLRRFCMASMSILKAKMCCLIKATKVATQYRKNHFLPTLLFFNESVSVSPGCADQVAPCKGQAQFIKAQLVL